MRLPSPSTLDGYDDGGVHPMDPAHAVKYHETWDRLAFAWSQLDHMGLAIAK